MKKCLVIFIFLFAVKSFAQQNPDIKRTWHWYFGNGAGLDFSSGTVSVKTDGSILAPEGNATISNSNGQMLFYTDGITVWDRVHNIMPNGTGLNGCLSSTQSSIIIPHPGDSLLYYIFTTDCAENFGFKGFNYHIVNMSMNNNFGDVFIKNKVLFSPTVEKISAVKFHDTIYVCSHQYGNNSFYCYRITQLGLDTIPIISKTGSSHNNYWGDMKFSPNGEYVAVTLNNIQNFNEIFKFDKISGTIHSPIKLKGFGGEYGICFSPDSRFIYFTANGNVIYKFSLCVWDSASINSSYKIVQYSQDNSDFFGIQNSPIDYNEIYVSGATKDTLYSIKVSIDSFNRNAIFLNYKQSLAQLPNFIQSYFNDATIYFNCNNMISNNENLLLIPNVFTPNNDGVNDNFSIEIAGYKNIEFFIYNRWGNLLIHGNKDLNPEIKSEEKLWDGKIQKDDAPTGIYYYLIKITNTNNQTETKKGFFQLLK